MLKAGEAFWVFCEFVCLGSSAENTTLNLTLGNGRPLMVRKKSLERNKRQGLRRCLASLRTWVQGQNSSLKQ